MMKVEDVLNEMIKPTEGAYMNSSVVEEGYELKYQASAVSFLGMMVSTFEMIMVNQSDEDHDHFLELFTTVAKTTREDAKQQVVVNNIEEKDKDND